MFEAVIFDWDGTLADTRKVIVVSFLKALKEINLEVSTQFIERRIGVGASETFREILLAANRRFDEDILKQLVERKSKVQIELAMEVTLFDGARELLEALQGKVKVGLASMNNRAVIMHLLQKNELADCFDEILTVETVSHSKPDPEIFLKTAEQLETKPQVVWFLRIRSSALKQQNLQGWSASQLPQAFTMRKNLRWKDLI